MDCPCCGDSLSRGADLPEARWIRFGDRYCRSCYWLFAREGSELVALVAFCPEHGETPGRRATPLAFTKDE